MHYLKIIAVFLMAVFVAGCGESSSVKKPVSIHYYQNAPDLVDVVRFETFETNMVKAAENAVIVLGDSLKARGYTVYDTSGIAAIPIASNGSYAYRYGNFLVKVAEATGVRLIEVRIPALEQKLLAADPNAVYALPFRFVVAPGQYNNSRYLHICLVDPYSYLSQFTPFSQMLATELTAVRSELMAYIQAAFPTASFDPSFAPSTLPVPTDQLALIKIAEKQIGVTGLEGVAKLVQAGNLLMKTSAPPHSYTVNDQVYTKDYAALLPGNTLFKGFFNFPRFSAIKDGKVGTTAYPAWKIKDQSAQMECLIQNSIIHAYGKTGSDDPGQRIKYTTSSGDIYQLQIFDAYISPFLINAAGVGHFSTLPISVYIRETSPGSGVAGVYLQNPLFSAKRSFHDLSDSKLAANKPAWDANPLNKTKWPVYTRDEMAQFTLTKISALVAESLK